MMLKDQMTPLERMAAYNSGHDIDRLPCIPCIGNGAARVIGCKISEFRGNAQLMAKSQIATYRLFGHDILKIFTDLYTMAEAMGAKVNYPLDETAHLDKPAISNIAEIDQLKAPNPYKDGQLPQFLEAMKIALDEVGKEVGVLAALTAPLTNASFLIGAEELVKLMLKNPEVVHKLCEVSLQANLNYAEAILNSGCVITLNDPIASSTIISPKQFKEFAFPYLKRLIDYIHSRGKGVTLHICGKSSKIWEYMVEAGADCLSIDNVENLESLKQQVGSKVRIMGNVDPSNIMYQGTPEEVKSAVLSCLEKAYDSPKGYIVASGCGLPTETPFANIHAMMDTVRAVGYPVTKEKLERMKQDE